MRDRLLLSIGVTAAVFLIALLGWGIYQLTGDLLFFLGGMAILVGIIVFIADALLEGDKKE